MASFEEDCPVLVTRARTLAREKDFPLTREEAGARPSASLPGAGRFLAMQAAGCFGGRIGELGTGTGVGTAWMASAMPADCALVTVEIDPELAGAARSLFAGDPRVTVLTGDAPTGARTVVFASVTYPEPTPDEEPGQPRGIRCPA